MYIDIRLFARTIPFIENVKRPRYAKYLEYLMSPLRYCVENMCVQVDIRATTSNIMMVMLSTKNPSLMVNSPMSSQVNEASSLNFGLYFEIMEMNMVTASIRVIEIAPIETQSPCRGSFFPKNICTRKAANGRKRMRSE
tara:strand:+ start:927 stop:1343 length:417 start_codon:yes stop_codon:yes gene_type:complete